MPRYLLKTTGEDWKMHFQPDLPDAIYLEGILSYEDGVLTATEDQAIWTEQEYNNFILDLEFKTAEGTNSGIIVYASNTEN